MFDQGVSLSVLVPVFNEQRVLNYRHQVGNRLLTLLCNLATNLNLTDMETSRTIMQPYSTSKVFSPNAAAR